MYKVTKMWNNAKKGIIVRHLVVPNNVQNSKMF